LVVTVVAGDHLLASLLHQVLIHSQFRYSRLYRGGNDADVLIIGDSRGVHSFYAPAIEELTGLRVLNLSYNSLSPHIAEALLLDYLDHNRAPKVVVVEATSVVTQGAVAGELRTFANFSPRIGAMYAEAHPIAARAARLFWLYPLNSEFFLEALHYMRRSDQDWILHDVIPPQLAAERSSGGIVQGFPEEVEALGRIVREMQQRGIEVRIVAAPYLAAPVNAAQFIATIEQRTGAHVWNYFGAPIDRDGFADGVHLNEQGSRKLLPLLVRDGVFGMTRTATRL
jgi:hypothetical protein